MGQNLSAPTFEKNEQIVSEAKSVAEDVQSFFENAQDTISTIEEEVKKARKYARSISEVYRKVSAFVEPIQNVIDNTSLPKSVRDGAKEIKGEVNSMLESLKSEFERAVRFIKENSGGGSGGSSGGGTATTGSSGLQLPPGLSGRRGTGRQARGMGGRGMGQSFETNDELLREANALLKELNQIEELPQNPQGGDDLAGDDLTGGSEEELLAGIGMTEGLLIGGAGAFILSQLVGSDD